MPLSMRKWGYRSFNGGTYHCSTKVDGEENMKKWRVVLLVGIILGIILGIVLDVINYFVTEIPYMIFIPLQIVAIVMIFGGFIGRKREKTQKERAVWQEK